MRFFFALSYHTSGIDISVGACWRSDAHDIKSEIFNMKIPLPFQYKLQGTILGHR